MICVGGMAMWEHTQLVTKSHRPHRPHPSGDLHLACSPVADEMLGDCKCSKALAKGEKPGQQIQIFFLHTNEIRDFS